jgi:hypothetical protein
LAFYSKNLGTYIPRYVLKDILLFKEKYRSFDTTSKETDDEEDERLIITKKKRH